MCRAAPRDPSDASPGRGVPVAAVAGGAGALLLLLGALLLLALLALRARRRRRRHQRTADRAALAIEKHPNVVGAPQTPGLLPESPPELSCTP